MSNFDFIAIDFETATSAMSSACAVGIAAVRNLVIVDEFYSLIQPPGNKYNDLNIGIHGITPEDTKQAPPFTELWPEISRFFSPHVPVVAHNSQFDMSVLRMSATFDIPDFVYVNSMDVAREFVEGSLSLDNCADEMHLCPEGFEHHNAMDDAVVCARILISGLRHFECLSLWEFLALYNLPRKFFSDLTPMRHLGARGGKKPERQAAPKPSELTPEGDVDEDNPLYGKSIVFTGQLSIDRAYAMQIAVNAGGIVKTTVSRKTDYLVIGVQDEAAVGPGGMSSKQKKALEINESGEGHITILSEDAFLSLAVGGRVEE